MEFLRAATDWFFWLHSLPGWGGRPTLATWRRRCRIFWGGFRPKSIGFESFLIEWPRRPTLRGMGGGRMRVVPPESPTQLHQRSCGVDDLTQSYATSGFFCDYLFANYEQWSVLSVGGAHLPGRRFRFLCAGHERPLVPSPAPSRSSPPPPPLRRCPCRSFPRPFFCKVSVRWRHPHLHL